MPESSVTLLSRASALELKLAGNVSERLSAGIPYDAFVISTTSAAYQFLIRSQTSGLFLGALGAR